MNAIQCNSSGMNATILMRIMPDLRSKYAIRVDGETVGDLETLDEALLALERLRDRDFTVEQARKMLVFPHQRTPAEAAANAALATGRLAVRPTVTRKAVSTSSVLSE